MALTYDQATSIAFPAVLKEREGGYTQYGGTPFLRLMKKLSGVTGITGGVAIEPILDYRVNQGAAFLDNKTDATSTTLTEVMTKAHYDWARLSVPITWNVFDEQDNAGKDDTQIVALQMGLVRNALKSFDKKIEQFVLGTSANGVVGIRSMITEDGTGTIGTLNAGTETFWANQFDEYTDANDVNVSVQTVYKACGMGDPEREPNILVSDAPTHTLFESTLEDRKRFVDTDKATSGFLVLMVYNGRYVYSPYGTDSIFMFNTAQTGLRYNKSGWRKLRDGVEHTNAGNVTRKILSSVQFVTANRSATGVSFT
jgi:hypothetical protein